MNKHIGYSQRYSILELFNSISYTPQVCWHFLCDFTPSIQAPFCSFHFSLFSSERQRIIFLLFSLNTIAMWLRDNFLSYLYLVLVTLCSVPSSMCLGCTLKTHQRVVSINMLWSNVFLSAVLQLNILWCQHMSCSFFSKFHLWMNGGFFGKNRHFLHNLNSLFFW